MAVADLVVGVSNDAVNFLNSAIGSQVASRKVIMMVASIGIFVGATFSSGMMEVARKGIFNPEFFFFGEIMVIFIAVMLTDIILLDFFNTVGLPTSTTVSIVFELLGAAVIVSLIKILSSDGNIASLGEYINSSQASKIIGGIFLSVGFAFLIGAMVQFLSRLLFSFQYEKSKKIVGSIWAGLAMTAMSYFLIFKGLKGASFVPGDVVLWVKEEMWTFIGISAVFWLVVMQLLTMAKVNVFKVIVLFGTFALAMAFAGNDLVNFIGVPIAGFQSYNAWLSSGQEAFTFTMESMQQKVPTPSYLLVIAGVIMIVTLWFSKKARSVTDTEVGLGRQDEGHERFNPNRLARGLVRFTLSAGKMTSGLLPASLRHRIGKNFEQPPVVEKQENPPAFDLVRAGVNLTTASVLIAIATSLKLPLSTTYVSFMVAMGTSLADRAWGRDSAVYRVAGVINVIGGWFATAIIAFTVAGLFALFIYYFQLTAITVLIAMALFFIYRSFTYHKEKDKKKQARLAFENSKEQIVFDQLSKELSQRIAGTLDLLKGSYRTALDGVIEENPKILIEADETIKQLLDKNEDLQYELYQSIKRIKEQDSEGSRVLLYVFDLEQDIVQSSELIVRSCRQHVQNMLNPLKAAQVGQLEHIRSEVLDYLGKVQQALLHQGQTAYDDVEAHKDRLLQVLEKAMSDQVNGIKDNDFGSRNSQLMFKILFETKDLVAVAARFGKLYHRIYDADKKTSFYSFNKND
ncbi:MAG: inorganic phosphate transporter [Bacteroidota bacterium]